MMEPKIRVVHDALTGQTTIEQLTAEEIAELESFDAAGTIVQGVVGSSVEALAESSAD